MIDKSLNGENKINYINKDVSKVVDLVLVAPYQNIAAFGVRALDSYMKQKGYEVRTLYFKERSQGDAYPSEKEVDLLVNFIKEVKPLLVGFSVMSPFNTVSRALTKKIKDQVKVPIIWGGIHPTICPEDCIDLVDALCLGEGELPLSQVIDSLRMNGRINTNIPNCWIKSDGKIIKNQITYMCRDINTLPYLDLTGKNVYFINNELIKEEDPYITNILEKNRYIYKSDRGCPFSCTYCGNKTIENVFKPLGRYTRQMDVDRIIGELKYVLSMFPNIEAFNCNDEVFMLNTQYTKEFSEKYRKEIHLPLSCQVYLTLLSEENVSLMSQAGLKSVSCGIEAFSEDIRRKVYKRRMSNKIIIEKARILHKFNIFVSYDFIYDNPLENGKDIEECFWNLIIHLPRPCSFNNYSLSHLPKTELTERFLKEGKIKETDIVGSSDKGLVQWKVTSDYTRNKRVTFWIILFRLFGSKFEFKNSFTIPLFIIKAIALTKSYYLLKLFQKTLSAINYLSKGILLNRIKTKIAFLSK